MNILSILAIVPVALFYGAYFIKQIMLNRQGISTMRLGRGAKPLKTRRIEIAVAVLNYLMPVVIIVSAIFREYLPHLRSLFFFGIAVQVIGTVYFVAAIVAMRTSWRAGIDANQQTSLITSGIYRICRNPAFVGFDMLYIGTTMVFPTLPLLILTPIAIAVFHLLILEEENYLAGKFADEYKLYKSTTLRY